MPIIEIISSVKNQFEYKNVKKNVFINAPTYIIGTQKKEENNG